MICEHILLITFLHEPKLILLHTAKMFHVFPCITNKSMNTSHLFTQLNDQQVLFQRIQFSRSDMFPSIIKYQTVLFDPKL